MLCHANRRLVQSGTMDAEEKTAFGRRKGRWETTTKSPARDYMLSTHVRLEQASDKRKGPKTSANRFAQYSQPQCASKTRDAFCLLSVNSFLNNCVV